MDKSKIKMTTDNDDNSSSNQHDAEDKLIDEQAINEATARVLGDATLEKLLSAHAIARKASEFALSQTVHIVLPNEQESAWNIESRPYQVDAWKAIEDARDSGEHKALIHLATGLGKTTVAVIDALRFMDKWLEDPANLAENRLPRILFACHQNEILEQANQRFEQFAPELTRGYYNGSNKDLSSNLTFATMQSLQKNLDKIPSEQFDFIIYDEAHHTQAETFSPVVKHFHPDFQLALTATPDRMDGKNIRELFGEEVYAKSLEEALVEGWLADVDYHIVLEKGVEEILKNESFDPKTLDELYEIFGNKTVNEEIAEQVKQEAHRLGLDNVKTIIFCQDIEQADEMAELLGGMAYHSKLPKQDRERILKAFKTNGLNTIVTRDMFNEGVDVPDARLLVFLRATASNTIFQQQLGRGLRKNTDKQTVSVLDFVSNIDRLKHIHDLAVKVQQVKDKDADPRENEDTEHQELFNVHSEFEFQKVAIKILEKLEALRTRFDWTPDQLIAKAREISPDEPLTSTRIASLSKEGQFASTGTIVKLFGSTAEFQRACGFEVKEGWSKDELIAMALKLSPNEPLITPRIVNLSKEGQFASIHTILKLFGSIAELQRACGFEVKEGWSKDELIAMALEISPDEPLNRRRIDSLSKHGQFASSTTICSLFGSTAEFQRACGFEVAQDSEEKKQQLIAKALKISPDEPLTKPRIKSLSKQGQFVGATTICSLFGSISEFQRACGFEVKDSWTKDGLISTALEISPSKPLTQKLINSLSKEGEFASGQTVQKLFGSISEFHRACGFEVKDK